MALEEYNRKRDFRKTPEPAGAPSARRRNAASAPLSFVIQKHAARRLHYDFRLELDGVLKSWAIPKGPSLDPAEKRLAVEVEDHPLDYGGFEGIIPKGEYGGGTVLLWDRGTWEPLEPDPQAGFREGMVKFALHGEKLHGHWMLVRLKRRPRDRSDNWLLIKERDEAARPGSGAAVVDDNPLSVESGRPVEAIAADPGRVWHSDKNAAEDATAPVPPPRRRPQPASRIAGAVKAPMPAAMRPQLASLAATAPGGEDWLHEIKYDGYRLIARIEGGEVRLLTRNGLDWTDKFPALARHLAALPVESAIVDGELVSLQPDGTSSFPALQDAISAKRTAELVFYAFDLPYRDGWDLTAARLDARKAALAEIIPPESGGALRYSDHQQGRGPELLGQAAAHGLEGIVSKRRDAPYQPGRGRAWLKVKCRNRDEFIIVGYTDPEGSREHLGALLLGYFDPRGALRYAGRVGSGFDAARLRDLHRRLEAVASDKPPVVLPPGVSGKGVHWTRPELVAEVEYAAWTADALIRQSTFQALREDKDPKEIVYDPASRAGAAPAAAPPPAVAPAAPPAAPPSPGAPVSAAASHRGDGSIAVAGVRLSHPDRVLYPDVGVTKQDLANYYLAIAERALPHLANRPLTLVRSPQGRAGKSFYQKHVGPGMPSQIKSVMIEGEEGIKPHPVIEDVGGLVALTQLGVLEIHPWGSRADDVEHPDRLTFDLDPDEGLPWARVVEAAVTVRDALAGVGLQSVVKTTGGKGLHVVLPLRPKLDWDAAKAFARWVAERLAEQAPTQFTANQTKRARQDRIYLDYLRNGRGATAVGAYSPRNRAGAPVSTPCAWAEVEAGVDPAQFTIATVPERVAGFAADPPADPAAGPPADPWAGLAELRQSLGARLRRHVGI